MIRNNVAVLWVLGLFFILAGVHADFLAGFVGDEIRYRDASWEILSGGPRSNLEHPLLAKSLHSFSAALFSLLGFDPLLGMRWVSILAAAGTLLAVYAIAARFVSNAAALLSVFLLASNSLFFVHARLISLEMVSLCLLLISLYFFLSDRWSESADASALAGAMIGLSLSAKWIGIWLVPWMVIRWVLARQFGRVAKFGGTLVLFYVIGNSAYFLNHSWADLPRWQIWALGYHQISADLSVYNGSPAWTWFAIPQHLYYARLMPEPGFARMVLGSMNPVVWLLIVPAIWVGVQSRRFGRWLVEAALCLYVPWMFVSRPTYFFYALTILPLICILESVLIARLWETRRFLSGALVGCALGFFVMFYPAAAGWRLSNGYERALAKFNFYERPVFDSMFCQKCNLYFSDGNE